MGKERFTPNSENPDSNSEQAADNESLYISKDGKSMTIDPRDISVDFMKIILLHQIFTTKRIKIKFKFPSYTDEITPKQLRDQLMHADEEERLMFIEDKAQELCYSDEITIHHLDD